MRVTYVSKNPLCAQRWTMPEQLLERPEKPPGRECRVYERQACALPTACRPAAAFNNKEATWSAVIRDISAGGIRLVLRRRFEPGTGLAIELPGNDETYTVLAKVIHVRATDDGSWALGCRFISELGDSEVERLLAATPGATRAATQPPYPEDSEERTVRDVRLRLALRPGTLINCVIRRFKATEDWPAAPGKVIAVRGGDDDEAWTLNVRVRHCVQYKEHWLLDCELANPPSVRQLLEALARLNGAGE